MYKKEFLGLKRKFYDKGTSGEGLFTGNNKEIWFGRIVQVAGRVPTISPSASIKTAFWLEFALSSSDNSIVILLPLMA